MATDHAQTAKRFHEAYERLAPSFGYETRKESAVPWEDVPENNRALMTAVCAEVVGALVAERDEARRIMSSREEWLEGKVEAAEAERDALAEALRRETQAFLAPYCKGGIQTCEICVGSCGIEGHQELVESVAVSPSTQGNPE